MPIQITDNITKYLGMPTQIGRSKQGVFKFIMDRVRNKLKGWKEKNLSFAGRGVLISDIIQAITTYMMSCFLIPKNICERIEKESCKYCKYGGSKPIRNLYWVNASELNTTPTQTSSILNKGLTLATLGEAFIKPFGFFGKGVAGKLAMAITLIYGRTTGLSCKMDTRPFPLTLSLHQLPKSEISYPITPISAGILC
ncbi:putative ribonuclease H protein [Trifolium medium]|uniref:Putative ribonuclease H protein n=1 Tax=Trifolium medium TaxID=97028 RepID=A0A392NDY5_9FABA|nr:putative ribonuclease H protein [Trifolium medium]